MKCERAHEERQFFHELTEIARISQVGVVWCRFWIQNTAWGLLTIPFPSIWGLMDSQKRILRLILQLGIILYPAFYVLDLATYPDYKIPILIIRASVTAYLALCYFLLAPLNEKRIFPLVLSAFGAASVGVSLICVVSGQGFASSYFAGILEIVLLSMALYTLAPKRYAILIGVIVAQHFLLNWFVPWEYKNLLTNIYTLGVISIAVLLVHSIVYRIIKENERLRGLLPICSKCKKIRDDKGFWHQVEEYINTHSGIEFSHGICPDCAKKLYGEFLPAN